MTTKINAPQAAKIGLAAMLVIATPLVSHFEGRRLMAYLDVGSVPTICDGRTTNVKLGDTATNAQCDAYLQAELTHFGQEVDLLVTVDMPPSRHAALTSFAYNVGLGAFARSTLLRELNAGRTRQACDQLMRWTKAAGVRWAGLVRRREAERQLCLEGL